MTRPTVVVRRATPADRRPVQQLLARAFAEDPQFTWFLGVYQDVGRRLERFFRIQFHDSLHYGLAEVATVDGVPVGAALWMRPGRAFPPARRQLADLPGHWRVFGRRLGVAARTLQAVGKVHPKELHWYLAVLGVDPDAQGQGVGAALLRSVLERADSAGEPAYLETNRERNEQIYAHLGFEVENRVVFDFGCPPSTTMWRPAPQAPTGSEA